MLRPPRLRYEFHGTHTIGLDPYAGPGTGLGDPPGDAHRQRISPRCRVMNSDTSATRVGTSHLESAGCWVATRLPSIGAQADRGQIAHLRGRRYGCPPGERRQHFSRMAGR